MSARSLLQKAIFMGIGITVVSGAFTIAMLNVSNYVFLPGMMVVYLVSGGVHGYASGVYLPSLSRWYALGFSVNVLIYSTLALVGLLLFRKRENRLL